MTRTQARTVARILESTPGIAAETVDVVQTENHDRGYSVRCAESHYPFRHQIDCLEEVSMVVGGAFAAHQLFAQKVGR